ncbi:Cytoplasmic tRNA 2-thiolation protein 1 [Nymphon striatum]|nr:Cytoplasmic tRNA 2-thiolation protein 1 [Nymphon striatum]
MYLVTSFVFITCLITKYKKKMAAILDVLSLYIMLLLDSLCLKTYVWTVYFFSGCKVITKLELGGHFGRFKPLNNDFIRFLVSNIRSICKYGPNICLDTLFVILASLRDALCKECFYWTFETEIHHTIMKANLFKPGEYIAIAASGGKDSTVLAHIMKLLNERHNYQLKLVLLSIDEGISGYRDDSLETVKRNQEQYELPLKILSYEDLYGWTMDAIVKKVGKKSNCTFCGVFRRQALDRGAIILGVDKIVTGHNADDIAETVIMNVLRGDIARLQRCTAITTGTDGALPRCKPFKYTYEKEIVMYAYLKKLDYFSTECIYSPNAYRGYAREFLKNLEAIRSTSIIDIIHSGECMSVKGGTKMPTQGVCKQCGYISSQDICKACVLLEGLNKGLPRLGIGKTSKVKKSGNFKANPSLYIK